MHLCLYNADVTGQRGHVSGWLLNGAVLVWVNSVLNDVPDRYNNTLFHLFTQHSSQGNWSKVCFDMFWRLLFRKVAYVCSTPDTWNMPLSKWAVVDCGDWDSKQFRELFNDPYICIYIIFSTILHYMLYIYIYIYIYIYMHIYIYI